MTKTKKLTVSEMKKLDTQFNDKKEISVQGYKVIIDLKFRQTKIQAFLDEVTKDMDTVRQNNLEIDMFGLYTLNLIKHFTDISFPDELEDKLKILVVMIDNDLLVPIYESFPKEELDKLADYMEKYRVGQEKYYDSLVKQMEEAEKEAKDSTEQEG